jgi:hypothetical protein|uniref:hypothetical protein n=1 Tax=Polynucleobacter sp. TaxID=2029855 RepID=UPI004048BFD5
MAGKISKNIIALVASIGVGITMTLLYLAEIIGLIPAIILALLFSTGSNYLILGKEGFKDKYKIKQKK